MTWLHCRYRKWRGFCMRVVNYLVLVCGSKLTWFLCGGIEIELILEWGSGLTWNYLDVCVRDRIWLGFSVGIESDLFFVRGIEIDVCGPELTCSKCNDRLTWFLCRRWWSKLTRFLDARLKSLGFSVSIEIDLWFLSGSILTWFQCGGSNMTWVQFRGGNWFGLCLGVENKFVLVSGSKLTWFVCDDVRPSQVDVSSWQILVDVLAMF